MKRPERVGDRAAAPTNPPTRRGRTHDVAKPARTPTGARSRASAQETPPGPARSRTARSEFSVADRRRKREERAEVRRFTRRARRRRLGWVAVLGLIVTMGALVAGAVYSPALSLQRVVVDGTQRLIADELVAAVDGQLGVPLALIDQNRIRTELSEFHLIRSYVTELVPPDTLLIHVVERQPIGVIAATDGFRLTDPAGVTVDVSASRPEGFPRIELAAGEDVEGPGFRSMAEVLLALPHSVLAQVDTIAARTRDDVTLTLGGSAQRVIWGSAADSDAKAAVLAQLLPHHASDGPGEYDVSAPGIGVFHKD